jgi:hypothetical protein
MAEIAIPKNLSADILRMIAELRPPPDTSTARGVPPSCVQANPRQKCVSMTEKSAIRRFPACRRRSNAPVGQPGRFELA